MGYKWEGGWQGAGGGRRCRECAGVHAGLQPGRQQLLTLPRSPPLHFLQNQLQSDLPFCAFNGGNDVFVDVGNKSLGLEALMNHLACTPSEVRRSAGLVLCGRESTV